MKTTKHKLKLSGAKAKKWKPTSSQPKRRKQAAKHGEKCFLTKQRTKSGLTDYGYPVCNSAGRVTGQVELFRFRSWETSSPNTNPTSGIFWANAAAHLIFGAVGFVWLRRMLDSLSAPVSGAESNSSRLAQTRS